MKIDSGVLLREVIDISKHAGEAILNLYHSAEELNITQKADKTPLTQADLLAHQILQQALSELTPTIPIISEEGKDIPFKTRRTWNQYWLIDPLDGTKEFLHRTGEFSVNVALIENHRPVLGVVYAPYLETLYFADQHTAYKQDKDSLIQQIRVSTPYATPIRITVSRRHIGEKTQAYLDALGSYELVLMGSALKLCLVAEGQADVYLRLGPTSEWDTAAGQCILTAAGGVITDLDNNKMEYNRKDSLRNTAFIALGDTSFPWQDYLENL